MQVEQSKHIFLNKEAAFANGLEMPRERWQASRRSPDLEVDQVAASSSKPFANAASLFKKICLFNLHAKGVLYTAATHGHADRRTLAGSPAK